LFARDGGGVVAALTSHRLDGLGCGIVAKLFSDDDQRSDEFVIGTNGQSDQSQPTICVSGDHLMVTWTSVDRKASSVEGQSFKLPDPSADVAAN
jgi:hypothetical protein